MAASCLDGPVIASSNRFLDIQPYCSVLYASDPLRWGSIFPWEFPQNGNKEQEEQFLRGCFSEQEIHLQGGAQKPGNGFRFLKQVWYTVALYNLEHRVPLVNEWFWTRSSFKELAFDPQTKTSFFSEQARPSAIFDDAELKMFGEKFLAVCITMIQHTGRKMLLQGNHNANDDHLTTVRKMDTHKHNTPRTDTVLKSAPDFCKKASRIEALPSNQAVNGTTIDPSANKYTHASFQRQKPVTQPHRFENVRESAVDQQSHIPRGDGLGKRRYSCRNRLDDLRQPEHGGYRAQLIGPLTRGEGVQLYRTQSQNVASDRPEFASGPQQTQYLNTNLPFYGQTKVAPRGHAGNGHLPPGRALVNYQTCEPSNGKDANLHGWVSSNDLYTAPFNEPYPPQREIPSGQSSSGNHSRALGGCPRGMKNGRRLSIALLDRPVYVSPQSSQRSTMPAISCMRPSSIANQYSRWVSEVDYAQPGRDGCSTEKSINPTHTATASHRRSFHEHQSHTRTGHPLQAEETWRAAPSRTLAFPIKSERSAPCAQGPQNEAFEHALGCGRDWIGAKNKYATKLIVYDVPRSLSQAAVVEYFSRFGDVCNVRVATLVRDLKCAFVQFAGAESARLCLDRKPDHSHILGALRIEVAKEHWDPTHHKFADGGHALDVGAHHSGIAQPTRQADAQSTRALSHSRAEPPRSQSKDITPTPSGASTPKKHYAKQQKKRKKLEHLQCKASGAATTRVERPPRIDQFCNDDQHEYLPEIAQRASAPADQENSHLTARPLRPLSQGELSDEHNTGVRPFVSEGPTIDSKTICKNERSSSESRASAPSGNASPGHTVSTWDDSYQTHARSADHWRQPFRAMKETQTSTQTCKSEHVENPDTSISTVPEIFDPGMKCVNGSPDKIHTILESVCRVDSRSEGQQQNKAGNVASSPKSWLKQEEEAHGEPEQNTTGDAAVSPGPDSTGESPPEALATHCSAPDSSAELDVLHVPHSTATVGSVSSIVSISDTAPTIPAEVGEGGAKKQKSMPSSTPKKVEKSKGPAQTESLSLFGRKKVNNVEAQRKSTVGRGKPTVFSGAGLALQDADKAETAAGEFSTGLSTTRPPEPARKKKKKRKKVKPCLENVSQSSKDTHGDQGHQWHAERELSPAQPHSGTPGKRRGLSTLLSGLFGSAQSSQRTTQGRVMPSDAEACATTADSTTQEMSIENIKTLAQSNPSAHDSLPVTSVAVSPGLPPTVVGSTDQSPPTRVPQIISNIDLGYLGPPGTGLGTHTLPMEVLKESNYQITDMNEDLNCASSGEEEKLHRLGVRSINGLNDATPQAKNLQSAEDTVWSKTALQLHDDCSDASSHTIGQVTPTSEDAQSPQTPTPARKLPTRRPGSGHLIQAKQPRNKYKKRIVSSKVSDVASVESVSSDQEIDATEGLRFPSSTGRDWKSQSAARSDPRYVYVGSVEEDDQGSRVLMNAAKLKELAAAKALKFQDQSR